MAFSEYQVPSFCYGCGAPYPWTDARLSSAREYVRELERLSENERGILSRSLDDIVADTPRTTVAALRFKELVAKGGSVASDALKTILFDITVEAAKRIIWQQ